MRLKKLIQTYPPVLVFSPAEGKFWYQCSGHAEEVHTLHTLHSLAFYVTQNTKEPSPNCRSCYYLRFFTFLPQNRFCTVRSVHYFLGSSAAATQVWRVTRVLLLPESQLGGWGPPTDQPPGRSDNGARGSDRGRASTRNEPPRRPENGRRPCPRGHGPIVRGPSWVSARWNGFVNQQRRRKWQALIFPRINGKFPRVMFDRKSIPMMRPLFVLQIWEVI